MTTQISSVIPEITIHNGRAITTSVAVANYFEKSHVDILPALKDGDSYSVQTEA